MSWLVIALGVVAFVELLRRLPLAAHLKQVRGAASRALAVIRSPGISDHWKEKVLLVYARRILVSSLAAFAMLLVALSPLLLAAAGGAYLGHKVFELLLSWPGILGATAVAAAYVWGRGRVVQR